MDTELLYRYQFQARSGLFISPETDPIAHCCLGLAGEAGEICDLVKKTQYHPAREYAHKDLLLEAGDLLWYLTNILDQHGYSLRQTIVANVHKLENRHPHKGVYSVEKLLASA